MEMELQKEQFKIVGKDLSIAQAIVRPSLTYWQDAWRRLKKNPAAILAIIILALLSLMAIFQPIFSVHSFSEQNLMLTNAKPGVQGHLFGTDELGRDLFVRVWIGARISLLIGLTGALIELVIGIIYGGISGFKGGMVDNLMMRVVDVLYVIPEIVMMILLIMVMGPGLLTVIIAISSLHWLPMARIVRGQILQIKEQEFVLAAKTLGASPSRLIGKHLIPNVIGPIIVRLTFSIPGAIFFEAFLSFIGMGVPQPLASWGTLAATGQQRIIAYPHLLLFPAAAISLAMLSFNMLGDGLRDALDPRLRK
ncbi:MAG: ABC transporter permease [Clostridia bacterium]